ncbi:MAG: hypothetical protein IIA45_01270 [Bacteroidetes bacterium]|nr:hypothetical protein [Bacteroidota bacterium]
MESNNLSYDIVEGLFFVTSFTELTEDLGESPDVIEEELKNLLNKDMIHQMKFNEQLKDYYQLDTSDYESVRAYHYVASKKGLLKHNERR